MIVALKARALMEYGITAEKDLRLNIEFKKGSTPPLRPGSEATPVVAALIELAALFSAACATLKTSCALDTTTCAASSTPFATCCAAFSTSVATTYAADVARYSV